MLAAPGRFLLVCGALLMVANVALGEGTYQRTRDGKTFVWNNHPKPGDEATWSGGRDREGYARGFGTLIWYTAEQGSETGSAKPALYARYWGHMVRGKLNGPVNVHSKRKTAYAIFTDGLRTTRWVAGPAPSRAGARWRAAIRRSEEKAQRSEPLTVQAENAQRPMAEREPAAPGEGPLIQRSEVRSQKSEVSNRTTDRAVAEENKAENAQPAYAKATAGQAPNSESFREQAAQRPMAEPAAPEEAPRRAQAADVDDSLLLLAWPPPVLGMRSISKGADARVSARIRARLSQEQVVDLADAAARSRGYDPTEYQRQDLQYDPSDQAWSLVYDERSPDETGERAKHLSVAVGDKTKRTAIVLSKQAETVNDSDQ